MINKLYLLICAWLGILIVGLGTTAPALVSTANNLGVVAGIGVAGVSILAMSKLAVMILKELENNNG